MKAIRTERVWGRADRQCYCGLCNRIVFKGEPAQFVHLAALEKVRVRCEHCVPGGAPPNLPPLVERVRREPALVHIPSGPDLLPLDFKSAAAGERVPGEEG